MANRSLEYSDFVYEEVIANLEEAQSRMLERADLPWAARTAGMTAVAAAEMGWTPLAEKGHRTAIHAYNLAYTTDVFGMNGESEYLVSPKALEEYIRLAEMLYTGPKNIYAHRSLHRLRRESLALGPLEPSLAIQGIAVVAETEERLASHSLTRRKAHARRARRLGDVCAVAGQGGGLPLQMLEDHEKPRTVRGWIHDIYRANII